MFYATAKQKIAANFSMYIYLNNIFDIIINIANNSGRKPHVKQFIPQDNSLW